MTRSKRQSGGVDDSQGTSELRSVDRIVRSLLLYDGSRGEDDEDTLVGYLHTCVPAKKGQAP